MGHKRLPLVDKHLLAFLHECCHLTAMAPILPEVVYMWEAGPRGGNSGDRMGVAQERCHQWNCVSEQSSPQLGQVVRKGGASPCNGSATMCHKLGIMGVCVGVYMCVYTCVCVRQDRM